jgi:hypothetical protein
MAVGITAVTVVIAAAAAMAHRLAAVSSIVLRPALARLRLSALRPVRQHVLAALRLLSLRPLGMKLRLLRRPRRRPEPKALERSSVSRWSAPEPSPIEFATGACPVCWLWA